MSDSEVPVQPETQPEAEVQAQPEAEVQAQPEAEAQAHSESLEMPVPQMTLEELNNFFNSFEIKPPHIVFNQEQHDRDLADGLINATRNTENHRYYLPAELKAAHGAATVNVAPVAGKKKVVIAITIAHNWPADYIQKCFNAFCTVYGISPVPSMEVINLGSLTSNGARDLGNPPLATAQEAAANQGIIDAISSYINTGTNGTLMSSVTGITTANRNLLAGIAPFNYSGNADKVGWLGELILNFWAIAMNPNAHFRIINGASAIGSDLYNTVVYASTDSNFATNPHGTTDYVNMSWGDTIPGGDRKLDDNKIFINPRMCYFAAAGNSRWAGYPATSSNVMCVGGASLNYTVTDPINLPTNPNVRLWVGATYDLTRDVNRGGGTGFSHSVVAGGEYERPVHQSGTTNGLQILSSTQYSNNRRVCPDMCSLADPETGLTILYVNNDGSKVSMVLSGGTSLASPLLCGLFSHLSQRRYNEELIPLTTRLTDVGVATLTGSVNLQKFLYNNFQSNPLGTMFYDIVSGTTRLHTNPQLGPNNGATFTTGPGYDIATGLGFPQMQSISNIMFPLQTAQQPGQSGTTGSATLIPSNNSQLTTSKIRFQFNIVA